MTAISWGPIFAALAKAAKDVEANTPMPSGAPMTEADAIAALTALETEIPIIRAWIAANQGKITGAVDMLDALTAQGVTWAAKVKSLLIALPGGLDAAETWLPTVLGLLNATEPVENTYADQNRRRGQV